MNVIMSGNTLPLVGGGSWKKKGERGGIRYGEDEGRRY